MRHILVVSVVAAGLSGCAAHEVYEKSGLSPSAADQDWATCQSAALAAAGQAQDADASRSQASVTGDRLVGELTPLDVTSGGTYSPADYLKITKRRKALHECMGAKGYRFLGAPAVEML